MLKSPLYMCFVILIGCMSCKKGALDPEDKIPERTQKRILLQDNIRKQLDTASVGLEQFAGVVDLSKVGFKKFGEGKQIHGATKYDILDSYKFPHGELQFSQTDNAGSFDYLMNGNLMFQQRFAEKFRIKMIYQGSIERINVSDEPAILDASMLVKVESDDDSLEFRLFSRDLDEEAKGGSRIMIDLQELSRLIDAIGGAGDDPFVSSGRLELKNNGYRVFGEGRAVNMGNNQVSLQFHEFRFEFPTENSNESPFYDVSGSLYTGEMAFGLLEFKSEGNRGAPQLNYEFY